MMRIEADIDQIGATDTTTISDGDISTSTGDLDLSPGSGNVDINGSVDVIGAGNTITIDNGTVTDSANDLTIDSDTINFVGSSNDVSVVDGDVLWQTNGQDALVQAATGASMNDMTLQGGTGSSSAGGNTYIKGGAANGTDKTGGIVYLYSGTATGNGYSSVTIGAVDGNYGAGTTTRNPTTYITCDGNLQRITMARNTYFAGTITANSSVDINGTLTVSTIDTDLTVTGFVHATSTDDYAIYGYSTAAAYAGVFARSNQATGLGIYVDNTADGYAIRATTGSATKSSVIIQNTSTGTALSVVGDGTGKGLTVHSKDDAITAVTSSGFAVYAESFDGVGIKARAGGSNNAGGDFIGSDSGGNASGIRAYGGQNGGDGGQFTGIGSGWGIRVYAGQTNGTGVLAYGYGSGDGITGSAQGSGTGVSGYGSTGYGVKAQGDLTSPEKAAFRLVPQNAQPNSPDEGAMYIDSSTNLLRVYINSNWRNVTTT